MNDDRDPCRSTPVEIDHLQEEVIDADTAREAAQAVTKLIRERPTLQALAGR